MKRSELLSLIEDAIWHGGGHKSNVQPDDLEGAAKSVLELIDKHMEPKHGSKEQSSYDLAMGSPTKYDKE